MADERRITVEEADRIIEDFESRAEARTEDLCRESKATPPSVGRGGKVTVP